MSNSLLFIVKMFLQKKQYQINSNDLKLQLLSHPSYPSLHAVTGVLNHFGIDNLALEVPQNTETLVQLPQVFIAHVNRAEGEDLVVVTKRKDHVELVFENKENKILRQEGFLEIWDGIIVVIEEEDKLLVSKQPLASLLSPLWVGSLAGILIAVLFIYVQASLFQWAYFIASVLGLLVSVLISRHDLGLYSEVVHKLCTASEKTSCNTVLNSNGAKLFGRVKLSDLGLVYFASLSFVFFLFIIANVENYSAFAVLSGLSLPMILYTIYYQGAVIKKWCPLCLGLAAILLLQFTIIAASDFLMLPFDLDIKTNLLLLLSFFSIGSIWASLKPLLERTKKLADLEVEHYKFKRNFTLFDVAHHQNPLLPMDIATQQEITFGAVDAPLQIVAVTNPLCFYCKKTHEILEKALAKNRDKIQITIRFNVNLKDKADKSYQIATRILELYHKEGESVCQVALQDIYSENVVVEDWLEQWGTCNFDEAYFNILEEEKTWCHQNNIHFTPALFVNGRLFPKVYEPDDLLYFVEELIEKQEAITNQLQPV